jgi:hypothetical protein
MSLLSEQQIAVPKPEPEKRDTAHVIADVKAFIKRFVFVQDENIYELLALWVVATHLYQEFEFAPYLFIHSPEKQSGKSRLLEVLHLLVANSSGILSSPTEAVLFRTAHGHTQLLDEADGWQNLANIRSVLNSGFQRNGIVTRMEKDANGSQKPVDFPVFAPRAIAGIGAKILGGTLSDRVYAIELVRQLPSERREKLRSARVAPEASALKSKIQDWVKTNRENVRKRYSEHQDFAYLSGFRDRTEDISEPLAVLLELMYGDDKVELDRARSSFRAAVAATRFEEDDSREEHTILSTLLTHMGQNEVLKVQPSQVVEWCTDVSDLNEYRVGDILRRYGFESKSVRIDGQARKAYVIDGHRLEELVKKFVQNRTAQNGNAEAVRVQY